MPLRNGRQITIGGPHPDAVELEAKRWETGACFANPDGTRTYTVFGSPIHYHDGADWQEIDNRWQAGVVPWQFQMTAAQYHAYALSQFNQGQIIRLEKAGHYVTYQAMALNWSNDLDQIQQIAMPAAVQGVVTNGGADSLVQGGEFHWAGAYGAGLDFTYIPSTHFFKKVLTVDALAHLGTPSAYILAQPNPCLQMNFVFTTDLDMWVDGAKWDKKTKKDTASRVEFKDAAGLVHWWWGVPSATDANGDRVQGKIRLKKQGSALYVSVQMPWSWLQGAVYPVRVDPDTYYGKTTDGYIYGSNATYATAHDTSTALNTDFEVVYVGQNIVYRAYRSYLEFNTSEIDDGATISQANLYLTCDYDESVTNFTVRIHEYIWTSPLAAGTREADYDGALAGTANAVTWKNTADAGFAINTPYASENLRALYIDKTGAKLTQYALVSDRDIAATQPTNNERICVHSQEDITQAYRPYLSITVEAGGPTDYPRSCAAAVATGATSGRLYGGTRAGAAGVTNTLTSGRLAGALRSAAGAVASAVVGSRVYGGVRAPDAAVGSLAETERLATYGRSGAAGVATEAVSARLAEYARSGAAAVGTAATSSRLAGLARIADATLALSAVGSRLVECARSAAGTVANGIEAVRVRGVPRTVAAAVTIGASAVRLLSMLRSAACAIGNGLTAGEEQCLHYSLLAAVSISATCTRIFGAVRVIPLYKSVYVNTLALADRVCSFSRSADAASAITGTASRLTGAVRSAGATISGTLTAGRQVALHCTTVAAVGITAASSRFTEALRGAGAAVAVGGSAVKKWMVKVIGAWYKV